MNIRLVYISSDCNQQFGRVVSVRTETADDTNKLSYPAAVYNPDNIGIASVCSITDWMDLSDDVLESVFVSGEKTVNHDGILCDVFDTEKNSEYLKQLAEAESEAGNG